MLSRAGLVVILAAFPLLAQVPGSAPAPAVYDVVSIKPNQSGNTNVSWRGAPEGFTASNITVEMLITDAYNTRESLVFNVPKWARSRHFDVNAKCTEAAPETLRKMSDDQQRGMLAAMLAERFHLKVHTETRELPVYDLIIAKDGAKLKPNNTRPENSDKPHEGLGPGQMWWNNGEMNGIAVPLTALTRSLEGDLNRTIVDRTGLSGNFDLHLKWTPDRNPSAGPESGQPGNPAPPLFTALQEQLGLRLVPARGPVQTWVVDHIELPSEN